MNGHYRIDASPSYKGNPQPTRSAPVNTVAQSPLYGRGGDQHGLDRGGRFVAYQPGPPPPPPSVTNTPMSAFRNAEERGGPRPHRMSLLHPPPQPQAEYSIPPASAPMTPRPDRPSQQGPPYGGESSGMGKMVPSLSESPPCKKLRLGDSKPDVHMPLRIDTDRTRSGPAYNPQVEAISPTLPSEPLRDESPLRSTKEDLMQQLARLDREIAKTESQIAKLKKKKVELEEAATQPQRDLEEPAPAPDTMNRSLPHIIYAENRKKALEAHQVLSKLGPKVDLPLYNQPSDTAVYHENKSKHASLKAKLHDYFKNKMREKEKRETYLTTTYAKLSADWARRLEKIENNSKKKAKDAKTREIFEKVFPELRKQREDKERFSRVGSRIKSDADLEEIMDGLHEQELEDKKMRSYAVIPPILLDEKSRKRRFNNRNGLIEDPMQEYKDKQLLNLWTEQEKEIFKEKYLQHPKNFSMIKSYLERKSVADCVQYYYLSKKAQNYRQLLRKNRARTRSTRNQQNSTSGQTGQVGSVAGGMATIKTETNGVTTRGQKEQVKNEQGVISNNGGGGGSSSGATASSSATPTSSTNAMTNSNTLNPNSNNGNNNSSNNSNNNNNNNGNNNLEAGNGNNGSPATPNSNSAGGIGGASGGGNSNSASNQTNFSNTGGSQSSSSSAVPSAAVPTSQENSVLSISASGQSSDYIGKSKSKRKEENKDALMNEMDSTDDENEPYTGEKGVPHSCVVCKSSVESYIQSRPLLRAQVAQYGLSESEVQPGDRVCNTCRCKSVRHRYKPSKQCPIPTCPAKKARVKRLRPFPAIWKDLSDEKRDAIMAKYQIPPTATKCCTACFNRINRRLSPNASLDTPDDPGSDTTRWTDDEIETMKKTLVEFGTDWRKLSEKINSKSDLQCRNFYFNFRKKYGLDALVQEYKKSKGGDGPPTLTDEEESGSTTSSCDETVAPSHDQSPRSSSNKNKDDYDSSATVSAEEGCGAEPEKQPNPGPEMRSMPMNSPTPLSLTVRHQQPASERNQGPPPSRIQSVAQHIHNQENGQQLSGTISLGSSHHSIVPQPQPPHATMSSLHPNHPLHSPQITASLALQQRSSPNIQVHPSQQQQQHPIYPTPVISHGSSQINHHNQGQPQGIPHHLSLHQARGLRYPSPEGPDGQEPPISVRVDDLMSATIERHLRRNPTTSSSVNSGTGQMHPGQSVSPTLQSILKSQPPPNAHHMISQIPQPGHLQHSGSNQGQLPQHQGQQGPPQHQQQQQGPPPQQQGPPPPQLVTAQVPTSSPHYPPHHGMNYGPKVDVRAMSQLQHHMVPREVSIVQLPPRDDCVTLDLSMKKRPASPNLPHQRPPSNGPPPAHQPLDYVSRGPPQGSPQDMYYAQKFSNPQRHPLQQPQLQRQQPQLVPPPPKQAKVPQPPALITKPPSLSPMKDGSITHGTPIHHTQQMSSKFEGLARPVSKEGSITQGTPKGPMYGMYERPPPAEYFKRMSPAGSPYYHGNPNAYYGQRPPSAGQRSPPHPPPQTSPFSADQHNSSRQIIINDYYTSQQMQPTQHPPQSTPSPLGQPRNVEQPKRTVNQPAGPGPMYMLPPRQEIPYRQSPPPSSIPPPTQHRQGVIQRATNRHFKAYCMRIGTVVKEEHGRYPQHDAFTSLVDVASSAPSLPVPKEENRRVCLPRVEMVRDGKSIVDMERSRVGPPMNQPNHPPPHQQSPHIYRPPPGTVTNQPSSDPIRVRGKEVYGREVQDSTLTAASLIDAIITHQINQPSPNDRSSPAPTNRTGDRLFASFQRSPAPQSSQGHGNPGNSQQGPHNLSIPNQVHSHGPPQHEEKVVVNDGRMNHKMPPGSMPSSSGGMGGNPSHSSQHHGPPTSSPQMMNQNTHLSKKNNNEDEVMHYKSWKLRKALQLENEKQQQQQQMHVQQQQHPDERRIIRVHTEEPNMTNRPPSMPSRMSPEGHYQRSERGDPPPSMKSGPSIGPGGVPSFGRREGISLDYFNNLIMEKMRNENNEEMKSEDGNERKHDPASSVPTMNLPGGSASHMHVHNPATSSVHAHTHFGGLAGRIAAAARDDMRSSSDSQRSGDNQHFQLKMEKMDDEPSKGGDSDSPASMVIDESADIKEGKSQQPHNESGSSATATSQPNYEPLTDEEN